MTTTIVSCIATLPAYADQSNCGQGDVHCTYLTGLDQTNLKDGRYIRITAVAAGQQVSHVECFNNSSTMDILQEDAKPGTYSVSASICKDKAGVDCKPVGTDNFVISGTAGAYTSNPTTFNINLSGIATDFPQCDATQE